MLNHSSTLDHDHWSNGHHWRQHMCDEHESAFLMNGCLTSKLEDSIINDSKTT